MPGALYLFGRKLPFSSDDLFLPGVVGIITRGSMTIGMAVCLGYALASDTQNPILNQLCPTRMATPIEIGFLASSFTFMAIHFIMYVHMIRVSTMGTILDWRKRHEKAEFLISALGISYFIEIALAVFGIVVIVSHPCNQENITWIVVLSTAVLLWVDLAFALGFAYFLYKHFSPGLSREANWYQKRLKGVGWGFNLLTCGLFGNLDTPDGYGDEAWIQFSEVFHAFVHDMMKDVVVTDVLAGILLLRAEQKRLHQETVNALADRAFSMSDPSTAPIFLSDGGLSSPGSPGSPGMDESSGNRSRMQSYLWSNERKTYVKLKAQLLASATPISPRGSWISNLIASEGRVADPGRRLEAFQALEEFANYSPYQEAIYGWKLFLYSTPLKFLASFKWLNTSWLLPKTTGHKRYSLGIKRPKLKSQIEGRVFTHVTGLKDHHVIYASFTAYLGESVPYTICVDHDREAVVVAIRGTMSYADLVTDLMCTPLDLEFAGRQWGFDGKGHYVHSGMFQVANRIRYDIEKQGILERLFNPREASGDTLPNDQPVQVEDMHDAEAFVTRKQLEQTDVSHYKLKIVGHSLGAGIATILSLLLREKFPKVTCLAYEPPGCIFSRELAEKSCEWVKAIVCGVDVVPRLSWHNAKRFRAQFFEMLRRSKTTKAKVMSTLFRSVPASELLYDLNQVPVEDTRVDIATMIQKLSLDTDSILDQVPMFLPGKILHLAKTETVYTSCRGRERKFAPMWIEDRADFNDIQINQWLLFDHFPNNNGRVIRKTFKEALEAEGRVSFGGGGLMDAINPKLEV